MTRTPPSQIGFGIATAFYLETPGNGPLQASYLHNKDVSVPSGVFSRSIANPLSTADSRLEVRAPAIAAERQACDEKTE